MIHDRSLFEELLRVRTAVEIKSGMMIAEPQALQTPPCSPNQRWESFDHDGATFRQGSWMSRVGPSKTPTSLLRR